MKDRIRRVVRRAAPPIAWRDEKLAERAEEVRGLQRDLRAARGELQSARSELRKAQGELRRSREREREASRRLLAPQEPSFLRMLHDLRRTVVPLRQVDPDKAHPLRQLPFKLRNYRLAASHGVPTPEVYEVWPSVEDIDLSSVPEEFVLKSDGGAGSRGVLPLRRRSDGTFEVVSTSTTMTATEIVSRLQGAKSLSGPFFAEEFLHPPADRGIPEDVKIYAFYGQVGQVLLRRADEHGNQARTFVRFVDEQGQDLGDAVVDPSLDHTIPVPERLDEMVEITRHLSRAVGVPFVRVDLYETGRGVVLGELTRGPGGQRTYAPAHDAFMGELYEDARWRLERDLAKGRPAGILHGPHPSPDHYPPGHVSRQADPGTWAVTRGACAWCDA